MMPPKGECKGELREAPLDACPGTYHFGGQQCATCVANSLRGAGITDFRAWKPTTLGNRLRALGW